MAISFPLAITLVTICAQAPIGRLNGDTKSAITYKFDFTSSSAISPAQVDWLASQKVIRLLDVTYSKISSKQLQRILARVDVRRLRLGPNQLKKDILRVISKEPHLAMLNLIGSKMPQDDLAPLKECRNLEELWIGHQGWNIHVDERTLVEMKALRMLAICGDRLPEQGLDSLSKLSQLKYIHLFVRKYPVDCRARLRRSLPTAEIAIFGLDPFAERPEGLGSEKRETEPVGSKN